MPASGRGFAFAKQVNKMRRIRRRTREGDRGMGGWVDLQKLIMVLDMKNGYKGGVRVGFINIKRYVQ